MDLTYSYLLMDAGYLLVWAAVFALRPDLRVMLLATSLPLGLVGLATNVLYVRDWWRPQTVTGLIPAPEDFLYGFGMGVACALAHVVLRTAASNPRAALARGRVRMAAYPLMMLGGAAGLYATHFALGLHTILGSILVLSVGLTWVLIRRPDLLLQAAASAVLFSLLSTVVYAAVSWLTPGWIDAFWYFDLWPRLVLLGMPVEDLLFYFVFGGFIGVQYHAWFGVSVVPAGQTGEPT